MFAIPLIVYLLFCTLIGFFGKNTLLGFMGTFVLCLVFTPLLVGAVLLLTSPKQ